MCHSNTIPGLFEHEVVVVNLVFSYDDADSVQVLREVLTG